MHKEIILLSLILCTLTTFTGYAQQVSNGQLVDVTAQIQSPLAPRKIHVWLPDSYDNKLKHDVLYMHDGQMLFDASTTWNKQDWGADETAGRLINQGKTRPFIIVALDNGGNELRHSEYFPQKPLSYLTPSRRKQLFQLNRDANTPLFGSEIQSDDYIKFIVFNVKPYIDQHFMVNKTRESTYLLGSSMGGLISLYGVLEYPNIFGGSANISTHWPGIMPQDENPVPEAFYAYIKDHLPAANQHKFYFDYGDQTLDKYYPPLQKQVDTIFRNNHFDNQHFKSDFYPGAKHDEISWQQRLDQPLLFLFGK